jgi:hypothetical protein
MPFERGSGVTSLTAPSNDAGLPATEGLRLTMPRVAYNAGGFPQPFMSVNGASDLELSWPFLVWSAISVGRAELLHIVRYGEFSLFEIAYRAAIVFANLCNNGAGRIRRSEAYDGLDPSEKGAISYFLGLTMAKAFAERLLGVPWLMHLDVYRQELQAVIGSLSRPDLVGQTSAGGWVGIESKGRTNGFDAHALNRAKEQAQMLASVAEQVPVLLIGMVTHFNDGQLQFTTSDPPARNHRDRVHLPLSRIRLIEGYYRPFRTWLAREPQAHRVEREGTMYLAAPLGAVDVTVGLAVDAMDEKLALPDPTDRRPSDSVTHYAGRDGVLVELGSMWSAENMNKEPQERTRGGYQDRSANAARQ